MGIYKVRAANGAGQVFEKSIEAENRNDLDSQLSKEGLVAVSVKEPLFDSFDFFSTGVTSKELLLFNKGLVALLKAGLTIKDCFETLRERTKNKFFNDTLGILIEDLKSGMAISEAMEKHPRIFPVLYRANISSGERTGDLVPSIYSYLEYQHMVETLRKKVVGAMFYPAVLLFLSLGAVAFLLTFVVPTFAGMYADMESDLPKLTQILLDSQAFLGNNFVLLLLGTISIIFALFMFFNSQTGKTLRDVALVKMPMLGEVYWGYAVSKFSKTLAMILKSGVPIVKALEMSKPVLSNIYLEKLLDEVIVRAKEGESMSLVMEELNFMPDVTLKMVAVGEKSASLPDILTDVAEFHDEEVTYKIQVFTGLIEPVMIVVMGAFIALIILMLYLPIFSLGEVI